MAEQQPSNNTFCKQCTRSLEYSTSYVVCEGFCSDVYHPECAAFTVNDVLSYRKLPNVFWMCANCIKVKDDIRKDRTLQTKRSEVISVPSTSSMDYGEEIAQLKQQVTAIHQSLANISTTRTTPTAEKEKRSLPLAQSSPITGMNLLCGTRSVDPNYSSDAFAFDDTVNGIYWLFFTRIKNTTTECEIRDIVADSLETDETTIEVKKLVPPWKDISTLPYISFKVGINIRHREKAMLQSTWPAGICYREFKNNIWEPASQRRSML